MVFLSLGGRSRGGLLRGRCVFSTGSPGRGMCGRRLRRWGCRGSRPICCGGGTGCSRGGGMRRWCWRGGMSRTCWRRGRSMGWRSRCSITASRWRCGGVTTRGCCWRIWGASTGWWRRMRRARESGAATWRSGSTKCWRWLRARRRRSCSRWRRCGPGGRSRSCRRRGRSMPTGRASCSRTRPMRRGSRLWRRARRGRRTSPIRAWRSGARRRRVSGMAGVAARKVRSMRCWAGRVCRRWSSSRSGAAFPARDSVKRVNLSGAGNPMRGAML